MHVTCGIWKACGKCKALPATWIWGICSFRSFLTHDSEHVWGIFDLIIPLFITIWSNILLANIDLGKHNQIRKQVLKKYTLHWTGGALSSSDKPMQIESRWRCIHLFLESRNLKGKTSHNLNSFFFFKLTCLQKIIWGCLLFTGRINI